VLSFLCRQRFQKLVVGGKSLSVVSDGLIRHIPLFASFAHAQNLGIHEDADRSGSVELG
jgi:hypothetical protein